jgi:hypothetical protein
MKLRLMEKPVYYLLAPNVQVLHPRARHRLVDDRPTYLATPAPALSPPSMLKPRSRPEASD